MLELIGSPSLEELISDTVPDSIRLNSRMDLPKPMSEIEFINHIKEMGEKNKVFKSLIGLGYNESITPGVIQRNILENPGWYTAYTPYQAEISQGRMEAILNFQTMVTDLTGMELSNASLLDESTAAAEAMNLLYVQRTKEKKSINSVSFFVDENVLPQTKSVLETRSAPLGIKLIYGNANEFKANNDFFGALIQYPGANGQIPQLEYIISNNLKFGVKTAVVADILSLVMLKSPGELGADVVVGSTQRFGIPLGYGGPHAAYFATKFEYKRSIPGRIIGVTQDKSGNRALRMALQTREQHIKRDRATSNICTAQVLLAVMAGMYAVYHGPEGLLNIAKSIHLKACKLDSALKKLGIIQLNDSFFDTLNIRTNTGKIKPLAEKNNFNLNYISKDQLSISINETTDDSDINKLIDIFSELAEKKLIRDSDSHESSIKDYQLRDTKFLTHEIFNKYRSETSMMRYIKILERKDLSLNHSMIALGSCTMKLNASIEMFPLSNPNWNNIHPFAPKNQCAGYIEMLKKLEKYLSIITGFSGTSLQPNSGAQGEYTGLMVIRAYHHSRNDYHRNICLIPSSAHGTNPASAVMSGMKVVVVNTDDNGNIDLNDLKSKAEIYKDNLSCLMITYPSTHGVFENKITEITQYVHAMGGQIYMDGANMNAQVGLTNPHLIGADVCHLNLHKTFAIPHGGGGPGVGPICVAKHLVPFLPGHFQLDISKENINSVSSAPYGSAMACLISYAYIKLLGEKGLKKATSIAILNSNYLKDRISSHYPVLYTGENKRSAHEFIIDCRGFKEKGIEVMDIAKRLMDYGFHAPTVSFPVPGTMMIEPTESENKEEIDRFCDALISIRFEIEASSKEQKNNILKNSPHTLEQVTSDDWDFPYSRSEAAFPIKSLHKFKFWPSVQRVDDAFGDRNLICSCVSTEQFKSFENKQIVKT